MGQDIFERKIDHAYGNCKGAVGIANDVQVFETHDVHFQEAIECTGITGIKHNFDKCIIKTKCCSFLIAYTVQKGSNLT